LSTVEGRPTHCRLTSTLDVTISGSILADIFGTRDSQSVNHVTSEWSSPLLFALMLPMSSTLAPPPPVLRHSNIANHDVSELNTLKPTIKISTINEDRLILSAARCRTMTVVSKRCMRIWSTEITRGRSGGELDFNRTWSVVTVRTSVVTEPAAAVWKLERSFTINQNS